MIWSKLFKGVEVSHKFLQYQSKMSKSSGLPLQEVINKLKDFADTSLASSWDNVGLLIEPSEHKNVTNILLTNDLTERVMQEAIELHTDLIISYHPPIFTPLKQLTNQSWKERIAVKCIEHKIALYSPHTSFDSIKGGVNDWLAGAFDIATSQPIDPSLLNPLNGMGRICTLKNPITDQEAVNLVKRRINMCYVRLARAHTNDKLINTVAVCAGSGASILNKVKADLFVTGEMLHHDVLNAVHNNTHVILTNHSDSERGFLQEFAKILDSMLNNSININVSKMDADPLITV